MSVCVPPNTDWSCRFTDAELATMKAEPASALQIEKAEAFGWSVLAALTAYSIGQCPIAVRPCAARSGGGSYYRSAAVRGGHTAALPAATIGMLNPYITGGHWVNGCGCSGADSCSCGPLSEVILPGPVGSIVSVEVDGVTLAGTEYRVDNGNRLVSLGEPWPECQNMTVNEGEGTFIVTYYRGAAPNIMTRAAAGLLAAEFYANCLGEQCRLPSNVTSMTRQGEQYEFEPTDFPEGKTGIPEVNAVVRIYNPYGLKSRPTVTSPDVGPSTRMRTA